MLQEKLDTTRERESRLRRENYAVLMPENPNKDQKSRLSFYVDWLAANQLSWYQPDLQAYRDYLLYERMRIDKRGQQKLATLSPQTVVAHLATIRGRYSELTRSNEVRDRLFELTNPEDAEVRAAGAGR